MSALASLLYDLGHNVIGSDVDDEYFTEQGLKLRNIHIYKFDEFCFDNTFTYIVGSAFNIMNKDVEKLIKNNFHYYYYHDFIGHVLNKEIIAVSGTHGKTTTTNFLYQMMDKKTSAIIGDGTGAGYTENNLLVLEACEYKNHFLSYHPSVLIITNIEHDHPDFFSNINEVRNSFEKLIEQSDIIIANGDDMSVNKIKCNRMIKVGQEEHNDIKFEIKNLKESGYDIYIHMIDKNIFVPLLGKHLLYDFLLSYVTCYIQGIDPKIDDLKLPKRRMEEVHYGNTLLINDYAHHPTEINALYEHLRLKYKNKKINVIFQPHTYSRTLKLKKEFKKVLSLFDNVYVDKVFTSAREKQNKYLQLKVDKIFKRFYCYSKNILNQINKENDEIWVFLGAGNINEYIKELK